ncbi:MAG: VIT domain-containing protein [Kofleriaceae bacterium]
MAGGDLRAGFRHPGSPRGRHPTRDRAGKPRPPRHAARRQGRRDSARAHRRPDPIDGNLAETIVTQKFVNPFATKIEAVYLFPLPTAAAVHDLTIKIGDRTIRGALQERATATAVYEAARKQGMVAAQLTQERPNLFTQSIANLEPRPSRWCGHAAGSPSCRAAPCVR